MALLVAGQSLASYQPWGRGDVPGVEGFDCGIGAFLRGSQVLMGFGALGFSEVLRF